MKKNTRTFLSIQLSLFSRRTSPGSFNPRPAMEFHISGEARLKYQFKESLFSLNGNVIIANFRAARTLAKQMNDKRDVINFPEKAVRAGQINAMGLIDEILHFVVQHYREEEKNTIMAELLVHLEKKLGTEKVETALEKFTRKFPPLTVYRKEITTKEYLAAKTTGIPNRELVLEELLLLWLANMNPAFSPFAELFDDSELKKLTSYTQITDSFHEFFEGQPFFGPENQNLIDMLRSPAIAVPHSLSGQLEYIRKKWGLLLGKYYYRLLSSLDFLKEEEKTGFWGKGPTRAYDFGALALEHEPERFSPDKDWMPRMVLLAKSTYVWLDQLSKKYRRNISRLDQIPDEELDTLARWGFTGIWLIGLWERSKASQKIKQMCGNPEAVASAYSLFDYQIAQDLGGDEAYQNLHDRCWRRGIHMCGDMVPNHMGIDSKWVIEHPDWFISLDYPPFPAYSFNGENVSWDQRVGIYIEDHYYSRSDAAVVFKRVDFHTGDTKYIYHGNDGTSMPWNDTAQLNYLKPEVREAVIQTILNVARKFSVIRFDAAMTLAKKHYQRLWFPEPGTGGDIPSRAEHGVTKADFDRLMPQEFWREVVDRVAQEVPDTLLLAEAFWLMEGYFVRTLGMHRVYNSAFMNMLKNEENGKYRTSIKNVLEFNPEILKRFVNFMNNPDEDTAIDQFGKDDKYFGVCMMMVTMPGLPMFGHGQIEGFTEKYGMEYKKAYWDETTDEHLVRRHEREIFPVMRKRYLFAEVENFLLYDFFTPEGNVNENVFAYSNRFREERGLVLYNNKFEEARGWVRSSVAFSVKTGDGDQRKLRQSNLGEGLGLHDNENYFTIFRDQISGLEFIRSSKELHEKGLYAELGAFKYQVFLDFREEPDNAWRHYANLCAYLEGRGVPSINEALKETFLRPVHQPFKQLVNADSFEEIYQAQITEIGKHPGDDFLDLQSQKYAALLNEVKHFTGGRGENAPNVEIFRKELAAFLQLAVLPAALKCKKSPLPGKTIAWLKKRTGSDQTLWYAQLGWLIIHRLGAVLDEADVAEISFSGIDEWLLKRIIENTLGELGLIPEEIRRANTWIKILTLHQKWWKPADDQKVSAHRFMQNLLKDSNVRFWLQVNRYRDILWYNKEAFENLMAGFLSILIIQGIAENELPEEACAEIRKNYSIIKALLKSEENSEFQLQKLLEGLKGRNSR